MSALVPALLLAALVAPVSAAQAPPTCGGVRATIVGTSAADRLTGTAGDDVIVALGGPDTVLGRGGDDLVCGGDGTDVLRGGAGDDRLYGERDGFHNFRGSRYLQPDVLAGGPGDDLLDVGADDRRVGSGSFGALDYRGSAAAVTLDLAAGTATGQGADTIVAGPGPACGLGCYGALVLGSAYDDVLLGSEGGDYLVGMAGDDRIDGRGGADLLRGEDEDGNGPPDADTMTGGAGGDVLEGDAGRDVLSGDGGDDTIWSSSGAPSQVYGGAGDDRLLVQLTRRPGFVLDGGEGFDAAQLAGPLSRPGEGGRPTAALITMAEGQVVANEVTWGTIAGVDDLQLGENVHWEYRGTDAAEILRSDGLDLTAFMYGGNDRVWGTTGPDRIDAGDGRDKVRGDRGRDRCLSAEVAWSCEVEG
ncbi:hypothetical protein GCM10027062_15190 [Nocardioides hungaricus]